MRALPHVAARMPAEVAMTGRSKSGKGHLRVSRCQSGGTVDLSSYATVPQPPSDMPFSAGHRPKG